MTSKGTGFKATMKKPVFVWNGKDVCISTNCAAPGNPVKIMPGKKNKHDPRFMGYKPIKHRSL